MHHATAIHIAQLIYNAALRRFEAVVEFFAPGMPVPLRVPVRVQAQPDMAHRRLVHALTREAQRQGIGRF
ncbi:hypothetical protein C8J27_10527 [Rhodobacter aestuarii]|uniref:Uncharacterized protein n=1 Tax=Rhodobacter aestuarii TaxID=453582 RepID=A0A1N7LQZ0_9RHOB|nr:MULTISPECIES: hypothetical protein [Rhodobacter]PTV95085.1 hypothetical protein C8J27_10527 [Rhodobacter aestuarii]SIS76257.1 hypothetical protein SAMN05421580_104249 [Rhodobacter aestuarii]SOC07279.1 hypothetical protein SAMN05877809_10427 [Rhodobacter sp. JA431]